MKNYVQYILLTFSWLVFTNVCHAQQAGFYVGSGHTLYIKGVTVSVPGDVTNNGTVNSTTTGVLHMNGITTQAITGTSAVTTTVGDLQINTTGGVSLGTDIDLSGSTGMEFNSGAITLNNSNTTFANSSNWTGNNSSSKFFVTNGTGMVYRNNEAGAITYPVGYSLSAAAYHPLTVTNSGTLDKIGVRLQNHVSNAYNSSNGNASGSNMSAHYVDAVWVLNENTSGGSNLSLTGQWQTADELSSFDRTNSWLYYYDYPLSKWVKGPTAAAAGSNPYTRTQTGLSQNMAFRVFGIGDNSSILPVALLNFEAIKNNNDADLYWETASERNSDKYEVERSTDNGETFTYIGEVRAAGNSNTELHYDFTDKDAGLQYAGQTVYYRLKQYDLDGQFTYTQIKFVQFDATAIETDKASIKVFPNPSADIFNVEIQKSPADNYNLQLLDMSGRLIWQQKMVTEENVNANTVIPIESMSAGQYLLYVKGEHQVSAQQFKLIKTN